MKTVDMETEYELGQKMIDALIKEKVAAGYVIHRLMRSFISHLVAL
jgi:DNA helicase TIP49 (TBP-interacting protein)